MSSSVKIINDNFLSEMTDGLTHINGNKLDCILSSHTNVITNLSCTSPDGVFPTDHYLIDFEIRCSFQRAKSVKRIIYDYKNVNFDDLRAHIGGVHAL